MVRRLVRWVRNGPQADRGQRRPPDGQGHGGRRGSGLNRWTGGLGSVDTAASPEALSAAGSELHLCSAGVSPCSLCSRDPASLRTRPRGPLLLRANSHAPWREVSGVSETRWRQRGDRAKRGDAAVRAASGRSPGACTPRGSGGAQGGSGLSVGPVPPAAVPAPPRLPDAPPLGQRSRA